MRPDPATAWWEQYSDAQLASEGFAPVGEVCERLGISRSSAYKLFATRELPEKYILSKRCASRFGLRMYLERGFKRAS